MAKWIVWEFFERLGIFLVAGQMTGGAAIQFHTEKTVVMLLQGGFIGRCGANKGARNHEETQNENVSAASHAMRQLSQFAERRQLC